MDQATLVRTPSSFDKRRHVVSHEGPPTPRPFGRVGLRAEIGKPHFAVDCSIGVVGRLQIGAGDYSGAPVDRTEEELGRTIIVQIANRQGRPAVVEVATSQLPRTLAIGHARQFNHVSGLRGLHTLWMATCDNVCMAALS